MEKDRKANPDTLGDSGKSNKGELIWLKINEDQEFQQQPQVLREAMRPYIEAMPTVLSDMLDQPVNLSTLVNAKLKFLRHSVDNGIIGVAINALPEEQKSFFGDESDMFQEMFNGIIDQLASMTGDLPGLLQEQEVTEEQVMLGPQLNLNPESRILYKTGQLTIEKLLLVNPMVIYKNSD